MSGRHRRHGKAPRGSTLLELLVVLAILGLIAGITGLGFPTRPQRGLIEPSLARLGEARRAAIQSGRPITVTLLRDGGAVVATAHPDGSVLADSSLGVDRLSGKGAR